MIKIRHNRIPHPTPDTKRKRNVNIIDSRSSINGPPHDKTNKMTVRPAKTQISLGIRPVWSESSLCAQWVAQDPSFLHAPSEDSDQTGRMPRLIWVFAGRTYHFVAFVVRQIEYKCKEHSPFLADGYQTIRNKANKKSKTNRKRTNNANQIKPQRKHRLERANKLLRERWVGGRECLNRSSTCTTLHLGSAVVYTHTRYSIEVSYDFEKKTLLIHHNIL